MSNQLMAASMPVLNKHLFNIHGPPSVKSDNQSEISSMDSEFSDIRTVGVTLGINPEDIHMERFKIDRMKLEDLLKTESYHEGMNKAEYLFTNLMKDTNTHISWPCRMKIGAKSKKDPHVRIMGLTENVNRAMDKVMACLDSRGNRVIMKMDVSYTDHSYIIGRGGNNIKRIMDETATHIHFPDSNRSNPIEKSNQVSLCGSMEGVERARNLVRLSTPLLISFELPIMAPGNPVPDCNTPIVKEVERQFNVQVIFSSRPKLHSAMVLIKGSEMDHKNVKDASKRLIQYLFWDNSEIIPVQMHIEISTQHHQVVLGKHSQSLREIMQRTSTQIMFPDANDMNIKPIKRTQVTITGTIHGVYLARQQLIGSLPVALIFDYPESYVDTEHINKLMYANDVFITVRQKSRQSTLCIVIKGIEKFIENVYEARHQLLNLTCDKLKPEIPSTYFAPKDLINQKDNQIANLLAGPYSPLSPVTPLPINNWPTTPNSDIAQKLRNMQISHSPLTASLLNQHNMMTNNLQVPGQHNMMGQRKLNQTSSTYGDMHTSGYSSFATDSSIMDRNTSGRPSMSSSSQPGTGSHNSSPESTLGYSQRQQMNPTSKINFGDSPQYKYPDQMRNSNGRKPSLNESMLFNYDARIVAGYNAMNMSPHQGEPRIPTPIWQGAGLSRTSPVPTENFNGNHNWRDQEGLFGSMTTSMLDSTPHRQRHQLSKYNDVTSLLNGLGLQHHIQHFISGEIDMTVFPTLTEHDLINLGVKTLGARRRIIMAIQDLASRKNLELMQQQQQAQNEVFASPPKFSGSAAPGAERRSSGN